MLTWQFFAFRIQYSIITTFSLTNELFSAKGKYQQMLEIKDMKNQEKKKKIDVASNKFKADKMGYRNPERNGLNE